MSFVKSFKEAWVNRHTIGDSKHSHELAAFLPPALEIQETPPNPLARWLAFSLLCLVFIAVLWSALGYVDIVASAEGKIIPSSRVKQIQPLEKGVVKSILVSEGDYVNEGQALIELDTTLTLADKNRLQSELHTTILTLAINKALVERIEMASKKEVEPQLLLSRDELNLNLSKAESIEEVNLYKNLFWQQWLQYWSQYQSLKSNLKRTKAEQAASKEIIIKLEKTLPLITKRTKTLEKLHKKDFVSEVDVMQSEQERIVNEQDLAAEKQRYKQLKASESEVREQMNNHVAQTSGALLSQITDQQRQIKVLEKEIVKASALNEKQILYAPVAGRVQELTINTIGGVVTEAQQLMLIVPDEKLLEVEVFLENKDIGFVYEDMSAEIKIHTFPFTKYGVIDAHIANVSNDAIVDEERGLIYGIQLRMAKNTIMVNGKTVNLMPGMAVTAEVKTGKRRVIEFFLAPLLKAKKESIRER